MPSLAEEAMFNLTLVELVVVERSEFPRQPAKRPDSPSWAVTTSMIIATRAFCANARPLSDFALHFDQRIARRERIRIQIGMAICRKR